MILRGVEHESVQAQLLDAVPFTLAERHEERRYVVHRVVVAQNDVARDEVPTVGERDRDALLCSRD